MKAVTKSLVSFSLALFGSVAALATTSDQAYLDACRKSPGIPVPIAVVTPTVGPEFVGTKVEVQFTVDATGTPVGLHVEPAADPTLAASLTEAIRQWKFKPAERNGVAVPTKVVLPVKVVDPFAGSSYAAN